MLGRKHSMMLLLLAMLMFSTMLVLLPAARAEDGVVARIWTDKEDYTPGETVSIFGSGFNALTNVTVTIERPDGAMDTVYAVADDVGGFTCTYQLDGIEGTYTVTATDGTNTATTTFTDVVQVDTTTTLNAISSPLTVGQTGVSYSGQVSATPSVPNGQTVKLQVSSDNVNFADIATTTTTGGTGAFSGTFTAPSSAGTYYFRALFPATGAIGGYKIGGNRNQMSKP